MFYSPVNPERFSPQSKRPPPKTKKRASPISIRVSDEERARLKELAGEQSINGYVRDRIFDNKSRSKRRGKATVRDQEALARALSLLGRSDIQLRLSALILALEMQHGLVSKQTEFDAQDACADVKEIRLALIRALGLKS